jgi:hypothetical protein
MAIVMITESVNCDGWNDCNWEEMDVSDLQRQFIADGEREKFG